MQRPPRWERPSFHDALLLVANADAPHHAFTPLIDIHPPTNVTVRPIVIDGRRDSDAETGEKPVMVMMMVVVMILHELEQRFRLLRPSKIVRNQTGSRVRNWVEKIGIRMSCRDTGRNGRSGLGRAGREYHGSAAKQKGEIRFHSESSGKMIAYGELPATSVVPPSAPSTTLAL